MESFIEIFGIEMCIAKVAVCASLPRLILTFSSIRQSLQTVTVCVPAESRSSSLPSLGIRWMRDNLATDSSRCQYSPGFVLPPLCRSILCSNQDFVYEQSKERSSRLLRVQKEKHHISSTTARRNRTNDENTRDVSVSLRYIYAGTG